MGWHGAEPNKMMPHNVQREMWQMHSEIFFVEGDEVENRTMCHCMHKVACWWYRAVERQLATASMQRNASPCAKGTMSYFGVTIARGWCNVISKKPTR